MMSNTLFWFIFISMSLLALSIILFELILKNIKFFLRKDRTKIEEYFIKNLLPFLIFSFFLISFRYVLLHEIEFLKNEIYLKIIDSILILSNTFLIIKIYSTYNFVIREKLIKEAEKRKIVFVENSGYQLVSKLVMIGMFLIGVTVILHRWGINLTVIMGSLGLAGLAFSLAAKDTLENVIAGILLIYDKNFKVGDFVELPSSGVSGEVLDIGLRTTRIRSWNNEELIIPNVKVATDIIKNDMYPTPEVRVVIKFSVEYGTDIDKLKKVVENEIKKIPYLVLDDDHKLKINFVSFGDSGLNFEVKFWINDIKNKIDSCTLANELIYKAFKKNKINFAYPTRVVYQKSKK
ncbi:MAG: mechanosensitive ion channel family protein [Candidatus Woesearchaeota archaeon]